MCALIEIINEFLAYTLIAGVSGLVQLIVQHIRNTSCQHLLFRLLHILMILANYAVTKVTATAQCVGHTLTSG